jgi:hypothetical protein
MLRSCDVLFIERGRRDEQGFRVRTIWAFWAQKIKFY